MSTWQLCGPRDITFAELGGALPRAVSEGTVTGHAGCVASQNVPSPSGGVVCNHVPVSQGGSCRGL